MEALYSLGAILRWGSSAAVMFARCELLPLILKKRLGDTTDNDCMLELAEIMGECSRYEFFCSAVVEHGLLEHLVGLAFASTKGMSRPARNKFKMVLLTLAVEATKRDSLFAVRNNLSAVIVEILKQDKEPELVVKAL